MDPRLPTISRRDLLSAAALIGAGACSPGFAQIDRGYGMPRVSLPDFPTGDMLTGGGTGAIWAHLLTTSSLLNVTPEGRVTGGLALSWALSPDRLRLDLHLRIDALFADGTRVVPEDVLASVVDARERQSGFPEAWRWDNMETVEVTPDGAIRFTLMAPDASFPALLASRLTPVYPATWIAQGWDHEAGPFPPSSGGFQLESRSDDRLRFSRNDGFYQVGRPRLAGVVCTAPVESIPRTTDLVTNGVDLMIDVPLLDVAQLREDPGILLAGGPTNRLCMLVVNLRSQVLSDSRMRRLLSGVIDREELVRSATAGEALPAAALIPGEHWAGLNVDREVADANDVRDQLAALGNPPGVDLRLIANEADASLANASVVLQEQLAWAGIALTLDFLDDAAMETGLAGAAWDLAIRYSPYWDDPHELVRPLLTSDGPANVGGFRNQRLDYLVGLANRARGNENRGRLYRAIEEIVVNEVPVIPLFFPNYYDAMGARMQDYPYFPPISVSAMNQATMIRSEPFERP